MAEDKEEPAHTPSPSVDAPPTIQLDHFLQSCGVSTGGQAKRLIQSGEVMVNNKVETRRKKKLSLGDVVAIDGEEYEVVMDETVDEEE